MGVKRFQWIAVLAGLGACSEKLDGPTPRLSDSGASPIDPQVVCVEQLDTQIAIAGEGMSPLAVDVAHDPTLILPTVRATRVAAVPGGNASAVDLEWSGRADGPNGSLLRWGSQSSMEIGVRPAMLLPDGTRGPLPTGVYDLTVENANGASASAPAVLALVPPPTLERFEPPAECTVDDTQEVVVVGTGFLDIAGALPSATLDGVQITSLSVDDCEPVPVTGLSVRMCRRLTVRLPKEDTSEVRHPLVVVTNPAAAGCSVSSAALVLTPRPRLDSSAPPVLCDDGREQVLTLAGAWLQTVDGTKPTVTVDDTTLDPSVVVPAACRPIEVSGLSLETCDAVSITVDPDLVEGDRASIVATNPVPVDCRAAPLDVPLVTIPTLSSATPALVCTDDAARAITLQGDHFLRLLGVGVRVWVGDVEAQVDGMSGCQAVEVLGVPGVERCTTVEITAPLGALAPGLVRVTVQDPSPIGCSASAELLLAPPHLVIERVEPGSVCAAAGGQVVTVHGDGFLIVQDEQGGQGEPTVTLGDTVFPIVADSLADCTTLNIPGGGTAQSCTRFDVDLPAGAFPEGDVAVTVQNPGPAACGAEATGVFYSVPVPEVGSVEPTSFCSAQGGTLLVRGAKFSPAAEVSLVDQGVVVGRATVTFISDSELEADFGADIAPGVYDLVVDNARGCSGSLPLAVEVHPNPLVFFVDPPVVYSGITVEATVYLSGLDAPAAEVMLRGPTGEERVIAGASKPGEPNRISVQIPQGLAPGEWSVQVTSAIGCVGTLPGAFTVTDRLTVQIDAVDPSFVWTGRSTPITITSDAGGFVRTPRAYMNPRDAAPGTPATNVRAVLFDSAKTLTGVIPAGLASDQEYELIVVNPDGTVGLYAPVTVTTNPPPEVSAILPASLDANGTQRASIIGENFSTDAMTATMLCRKPDGTSTGPLAVVPVAGTLTATRFDANFPTGVVGAGATCVVTVVSSEGASFRYSAVSTKTPAQNLNAWRDAGVLLQTPRRALGLAAARPTSQSRFIFAVGGDGGSAASALDTVEAANVGLFGDLGAFTIQRNRLPSARTMAGVARVGRFVYAVGGMAPEGAEGAMVATRTVLRAPVLDPLATPEVVDLGVTLLAEDDPRPGVEPGLWIYRVSAVFAADDAVDPGGETLPGEPLVVQLPDVDQLSLTLTWDAIPGAVAYRVYRTPAPELGVDAVELLGETVERSFIDAGDLSTDPARLPLPAGSLGRWSVVANLGTARASAAVAVAASPSAPNVTYLYAFGGRDTAPLATWEYTTVTTTPPVSAKDREHASVGAFVAGNGALGVARSEAAAWVVRDTDVVSGVPAGRTWIFVGPGRTAASTTDRVDAGLVLSDGRLGDASEVAGLVAPAKRPSAAAGYGVGVANGFLFTFGGAGGSASKGGISGELCLGLGVGGCNPDRLPEVRNWNALGVDMTVSRVLFASTQESAFFFVAGGFDGVAVTRRVDVTVQ